MHPIERAIQTVALSTSYAQGTAVPETCRAPAPLTRELLKMSDEVQLTAYQIPCGTNGSGVLLVAEGNPRARLNTFESTLRRQENAIEIDSGSDNAYGFMRRSHSVLTSWHCRDPGHLTREVLERPIAIFRR